MFTCSSAQQPKVEAGIHLSKMSATKELSFHEPKQIEKTIFEFLSLERLCLGLVFNPGLDLGRPRPTVPNAVPVRLSQHTRLFIITGLPGIRHYR